SGALLLAPRAVSAGSLRRPRTWLGGAAVAAALYLLCGPLLGPWLHPWPASHPPWPSLFARAAALPLFAPLERRPRVPGPAGALLPALARGLVIALLAAAGFTGLAEPGALLAARVLALGAPLLELLAQRCARCAPEPWTSAIAQSLLVGWSFGTLF